MSTKLVPLGLIPGGAARGRACYDTESGGVTPLETRVDLPRVNLQHPTVWVVRAGCGALFSRYRNSLQNHTTLTEEFEDDIGVSKGPDFRNVVRTSKLEWCRRSY